ncbi:MAG: glycine cleavage system protein GcvH [Candidatus Acidiferrales bacterium]
MTTYPSDYRYTREHEWVAAKGDLATVGITDYAQHELGDVVYVGLPEVGTAMKAGQTLGSVESVKTMSDIYAPVSGTVVEINSELTAAPEKVNQDPHGAAWMVRMKLSDAAELRGLLDAAAYQAFIAEKDSTA